MIYTYKIFDHITQIMNINMLVNLNESISEFIIFLTGANRVFKTTKCIVIVAGVFSTSLQQKFEVGK